MWRAAQHRRAISLCLRFFAVASGLVALLSEGMSAAELEGEPGRRRLEVQPLGQEMRSESRLTLIERALAADPDLLFVCRRQLAQQRFATRCRQVDQRLARAAANLSEVRGHSCEWDPRNRARRLFDELHRTWLTGPYDPGCARLDATLRDGRFNCLTATMLYIALCREWGIRARALAAPSHVLVAITLDGSDYAVETTTSHWQLTPLPRGAEKSLLTDTQLIARLYYNLGIQLAMNAEYRRSVAVTDLAWRLDPEFTVAKENWLAAITNWALELIDSGHWNRARQVIAIGLSQSPNYAPLLRANKFLRRGEAA